MEQVTLGLAVLLAVGMLAAKAGQKLKLPSVTGYILAGLLLGPSGIGLVTSDSIGHKLDHFTDIALMLIAFGIGEQIELRKLKSSAKTIGAIGFSETSGSFLFVATSTFFAAQLFGVNEVFWGMNDYLILSLLLGAISVATAPATTLHVMKEAKAKGPFTSTLMAVVAINNGLAIIFFGVAMSVAGKIVDATGGSFSGAVLNSLSDITFSLLGGVITGLAISFFLPRLKQQGEMLTAGLTLLLLCGEICRLFSISPLLAGMAAGFTVINRVTRDVRLFRALNAFEPPIYVLFFTLAGTHLDIFSLGSAGWVAVIYFASRMLGKYCGSYSGAWLSQAMPRVRNFLGLALIPQAGVAIGLVILVRGNENLGQFADIITPVVLAGVVLAELCGPVVARFAVEKAGEVNSGQDVAEKESGRGKDKKLPVDFAHAAADISIVPWTWGKLRPHSTPRGVVAFGASHPATACGLARMATILAHHFKSRPMSVRVVQPGIRNYALHSAFEALFSGEKDEVETLGYSLETELIQSSDIASSLVSAVEYNNARAVVLGYPIEGTVQGFQQILEKVAKNVACPVVVVRFYGELHTERILIPVISMNDLEDVRPIVHALSRVGEHQLTILYLLPADESDATVDHKTAELAKWVAGHKINPTIRFHVERTEARQETILQESEKNDLIVMGTSRKNVLKRLFFGSLAETVASNSKKSLLIVYRPANEALLAELNKQAPI
ncbi:MAG: cation:proton antiporter [Desulfobulbaceae bacterium]|nr:cation:proton antiporter [Desulfobulbaceae bacterium]